MHKRKGFCSSVFGGFSYAKTVEKALIICYYRNEFFRYRGGAYWRKMNGKIAISVFGWAWYWRFYASALQAWKRSALCILRIWIQPLLHWYHQSFPEVPRQVLKNWQDFGRYLQDWRRTSVFGRRIWMEWYQWLSCLQFCLRIPCFIKKRNACLSETMQTEKDLSSATSTIRMGEDTEDHSLLFECCENCSSYFPCKRRYMMIPGSKGQKTDASSLARGFLISWPAKTWVSSHFSKKNERITNVFEDCGSAKHVAIWYQRSQKTFWPQHHGNKADKCASNSMNPSIFEGLFRWTQAPYSWFIISQCFYVFKPCTYIYIFLFFSKKHLTNHLLSCIIHIVADANSDSERKQMR